MKVAINSSIDKSHKKSPFEIVYSREPKLMNAAAWSIPTAFDNQ